MKHDSMNHRLVWYGMAAALIFGCSNDEALQPVPGEVAAPGQVNLAPQLGGVVQALGPHVIELVSQPEGLLVAQVRDLRGRPILSDRASLNAEISGSGEPVQVVMTPAGDRYLGIAAGVEGRRPVSLYYTPPDSAVELSAAYPEVHVHPSQIEVDPRHHGQVVVVGDNRLEVTAAPTGEVMMSVTDLEGVPVPPSAVELEEVHIVTPEGPQVVALEPQGAVFVGTLGVAPPPSFNVSFDVSIGGVAYHHLRLRHFHPLPPGVVVVAPAPPLAWGVPYVEYRIGHPGKGWAKGHWGGHPGKGWAKGHWGGNPGKGWAKGHWGGNPGRGHGRGRGGGHGRGRGHGKGW